MTIFGKSIPAGSAKGKDFHRLVKHRNYKVSNFFLPNVRPVLKLISVPRLGLNSEKREHLLKTASGSDKVTIKNIAKASSTPRQISEINLFARTFNYSPR